MAATPAILELLHGAGDVHRGAVAGVGVEDDRNINGCSDIACYQCAFGEGDQADVGSAEQAGGHAVAGDADGLETGGLGEPGGEAVEDGRHLDDLRVC